LICLPAEADLINAEGFRVRLPIPRPQDPVLLESRKLPGTVTAGGTTSANPADYDLIGLAMQEPQYARPACANSWMRCEVGQALHVDHEHAAAAYMRRIPGLNGDSLKPAYTDAGVWDSFDPERMTLNSPDPQAIRPPEEKVNFLQVTLPTNFKVAKFKDDKATAILRQLEKDVDAARFDTPEGKTELPVKLKVYDSIFVPLAKWAMLLSGNYRCITKDGMRTAQEAVHSDIETSRSVYNFVTTSASSWVPIRPIWLPFESMPRPPRAGAAGVGGARPQQRRAQYRAGRQAGAAHRQAEGAQPPGDRCRCRSGRRAPRSEPQESGRLKGVARRNAVSSA